MVVAHKFGSMVIEKLIILKIILLLSSCASTLSGTVYDEHGNIVRTENGMINIVPLDKKQKPLTVSVVITKDGSYEVKDKLPVGYYFLEALVPGYEITSLRFHVDSVDEMDLTLIKSDHRDTSNEPIHALNQEPQRKEPGKVRLDPPGF
ncbi:MAG: carboxypeptidase-like regulatory domain-containing protein [Oligoflexales bacterium]